MSTPTELIGFSPDVESILMESEFPEAEFDDEFNIFDEDDNEDPDEEDLELCVRKLFTAVAIYLFLGQTLLKNTISLVFLLKYSHS